MVRIVVDANVLVSAAYGGTPLDAVGRAFTIGTVCVSPRVVAEIEMTMELLAPKLGDARSRSLLELWRRLRGRCRVLEPRREIWVFRDPKDDACLALCAAAEADFLITGDKDLLAIDLARTPGLPRSLKIATPRQFLDQTG